MSLPSSGPISISQIHNEVGNGSYSLHSLSVAAGKSTPDSMSEFYGWSSTPATVYFSNDESSFGGDANLRIYAYDAAGNNILSEWWLWGTDSGNLGSRTGITFKQGYTIQVYAYNWGASLEHLWVARNNSIIFTECGNPGCGPYTITVNAGDVIEIYNLANSCTFLSI
jgi:hypothetical protein